MGFIRGDRNGNKAKVDQVKPPTEKPKLNKVNKTTAKLSFYSWIYDQSSQFLSKKRNSFEFEFTHLLELRVL